MQISAAATCGLLLVASNIFMTFAWYAHLKNLAEKPWRRHGWVYFIFRG
jgi:uncharacterized protein